MGIDRAEEEKKTGNKVIKKKPQEQSRPGHLTRYI
jgi:hypothetical protein